MSADRGYRPRTKSATTPIAERLRAGSKAREMSNVNRSVLMADGADAIDTLLKAAKEVINRPGIATHNALRATIAQVEGRRP